MLRKHKRSLLGTDKHDSVILFLGAKHYKLEVTSSSNVSTESLKTATTEATATALRPGSWYKLRVISIGDLGVKNVDRKVFVSAQTGWFSV